jgi:hypothetical protein
VKGEQPALALKFKPEDNYKRHWTISTDRPWPPSQMNRHTSLRILGYWVLLSVLLRAGWCSAATHTWNGSISTDWFNSTNWIPAGVPASGDTINFTNGTTINLSSPITVSGVFNWFSGTLSGSPLTIANGGVMNITGGVSLQNVLTNLGTVTMSGAAGLAVYNDVSPYTGDVYNQAGALWDIQTNANISCEYCTSNEFFNNAGTFRKSGGSGGTATISVVFANTGTIDAMSGILSFTGTFTNSAGTLGFGVSGLANLGQINVAGAVTLSGTASVTWLGGFSPSVGNSFTLLNYGSHSGIFANIVLPPGSSGTGVYGVSAFSVTVTNVTGQTNVPVFLNIKLVNSNTVAVSWPSSATNYTLQTNANLSPATWGNVSSGIVTVGPNDVFSNNVAGKSDFFRLRSP